MNSKGPILLGVLLLTVLCAAAVAAQQADLAAQVVAAPVTPDAVTGLKGDLLTGKIVGIDADGILTMTGPQFVGKVALRLAALHAITLRCTRTESGRDAVTLTNGDRVVGEVTAITPEAVLLKTDIAGLLRISRRMVVSLGFAGGETVLLRNHFASGSMEPWKVRNGKWSVKDGRLTCESRTEFAAVYTRLARQEATTVVARVKAAPGHRLHCHLLLLANEGLQERPGFGDCVWAEFWQDRFKMGYSKGPGAAGYHEGRLGRVIREGTFRFAYDPQTGKTRAWLNSKDLGEYACPFAPTALQAVSFQSRYPSQTGALRVLRGVVPPPDIPAKALGDRETDLVIFRNMDRVSAQDLTMSKGHLSIQGTLGKLTVDAGKLSYVLFRRNGQVTPARVRGDVEVQTATGRMTMALTQLDDEHLLGTSSSLGHVKLKRDAVKSIRLNLLGAGESVGKKLLYLKEGHPATWTVKGGRLHQCEEIERWKSAGYDVTTRDMSETVITSKLLGEYRVLRFNGSHYFSKRKITVEEAEVLYRWVLNGGRLFADIYGGSPVLLAKKFGVARIESDQTARGPWPYYHGAPLTVGPVASDVFSVAHLAAEQLDRVTLAPEHHLTVAARYDGYPAVVHGRFDGGKVVMAFLANWSHDATNPGNLYRATVFQHGNLAFIEQAIKYLGK